MRRRLPRHWQDDALRAAAVLIGSFLLAYPLAHYALRAVLPG